MLAFANKPIDNMLAIGTVTDRGARIWTRTAEAEPHELCWWRRDAPSARQRLSLNAPDPRSDNTGSTWIDRGLEPNTAYRVALCDGNGTSLAEGSFTTAPDDTADPPETFSIALLSCHEPFDPNGQVSRSSELMLEAACRAFERHKVRQVVMAGDQLYADFPKKLSLFDDAYFRSIAPPGRQELLDCSAEEVRAMFHIRYRHFWNLKGWRKMLANFPCYPIIDDHEIVDNWGSAEAHREPRWQAYREGAFAAYRDYQAALVGNAGGATGSLDYHMTLADTATYVMDLRSNRQVGDGARIAAPEQFDAFEDFLVSMVHKRVVFVVLSVPAVHLPAGLSRLAAAITPDGEDFSDRWSSRGQCDDRDRLLRLLRDQQQRAPRQRIVLLSGDIHIGCLHRIHWPDNDPNVYQFISSGITHDTGRLVQLLSSLIIRANRKLSVEGVPDASVRLVAGERHAAENPCGRLNFGIIEMDRSDPGTEPALRFLLYTHDGVEPVCQYRSPDVSCGSSD
jgi:alkaline phosphatase D